MFSHAILEEANFKKILENILSMLLSKNKLIFILPEPIVH